MDLTRHTGRVVIATGAGSGIGQAAALRLAQEGALVVGCDVNAAGLEATLGLIHEAGHEATMVVADITKQADVERLVAETVALHGHVDVLANIAGINDWFLPAHEVDDETWTRVMAVNVDGVMRLCRQVLPLMMARKSGSIVNIASVGGLGGAAAGIAYTASKHALIGMTRSIAWVYRTEGIRCNVICPGGVETNIGTTSVPRSAWGFERLALGHALGGHMAKPDEIATLLSWLSSDEASNVSGAVVTADNGWRAV